MYHKRIHPIIFIYASKWPIDNWLSKIPIIICHTLFFRQISYSRNYIAKIGHKKTNPKILLNIISIIVNL